MVRRALALVATLAGCGGFVPVGDDAAVPDLAIESPFQVVQAKAEGEYLTSVWGADADHVFAVGSSGVKYTYMNGAWSSTQNEPGRDFYQVWGVSATEVYLVGQSRTNGSGVLERWDGTGWADEYLPPAGLYGLWGDQSVILAVGAGGQIHGKKRGTKDWGVRQTLDPNPDVMVTPDSPILWAVAGNSVDDIAIAADVDRVFHNVGMIFEFLDPDVDRTLTFRTVFATPNMTTNFFFGTNYLGVTWLNSAPPVDLGHVAGDMFTLMRDETPMGADGLFIRGIWGTQTKVLFVGDAARIYYFDAGNPDQLRTVPSPSVVSLYSVWGSSENDVWIVGERETILHGKMP
jgi:hypothetical protein